MTTLSTMTTTAGGWRSFAKTASLFMPAVLLSVVACLGALANGEPESLLPASVAAKLGVANLHKPATGKTTVPADAEARARAWLQAQRLANQGQCTPFLAEWRAPDEVASADNVFQMQGVMDLMAIGYLTKTNGMFATRAVRFKPTPEAGGGEAFQQLAWTTITRLADGSYGLVQHRDVADKTPASAYLDQMRLAGRPAPRNSAMFVAFFDCVK